jgi:hypothetical protein
MAILRDVVICYDGTVRNVSSNSIIQFEYGVKVGTESQSLFPAGEPVGVLAATAMSNPAYKAVLDSTPSSNCSWDMMKVAIALCKFFILVEVYFAIFCSVMLQIFLNISFLFRKYFFAKLVSRMT